MLTADQNASANAEAPSPVQADMGSFLRDFLATSSGSVLFFLSALFVLYGIGSIIGPILGESNALQETLPAIGALGFYELSLFAVLVALVLRWKVSGDTITLVILVGVFLVAVGMLVSTVANDEPDTIVAVGAVVGAMACLQIIGLRRWIRIPMSVTLLVSSAVLLLWNTLSAPGIAVWLENGGMDLSAAWRISAFIPVIAMILAYLGLMATTTGKFRTQDEPDFLNTPGMAWVFFATLVVGSTIHLFAHLYVFDLAFYLVDFLPVILLSAFILCEVLRAHNARAGVLEYIAALAPVMAFVLALAADSFDTATATGLGHLWSPWITLAGGAALGTVYAIRRAGPPWFLIPLSYGLAMLLLVQPTASSVQAAPGTVNWDAFRIGLMVVVPILALLSRNAVVVVVVLCGAVVLLPQIEAFRSLVSYESLDGEARISLLGTILGAGMTATYVVFGRRMPRQLALFGVAIFSFAAIALLAQGESVSSAVVVVASILLTGAVAWRMRDLPATAILVMPAGFGGYLLTSEAAGWRYVVVGFMLLAVGAALSIRNQRPVRESKST